MNGRTLRAEGRWLYDGPAAVAYCPGYHGAHAYEARATARLLATGVAEPHAAPGPWSAAADAYVAGEWVVTDAKGRVVVQVLPPDAEAWAREFARRRAAAAAPGAAA